MTKLKSELSVTTIRLKDGTDIVPSKIKHTKKGFKERLILIRRYDTYA